MWTSGENRVDETQLQNYISSLLNRLSQPVFALRLAWEQLSEQIHSHEAKASLLESFKVLSPIIEGSLSRLHEELSEHHARLTGSGVHTRFVSLKEVMGIMPRVQARCAALGVTVVYYTRRSSDVGREGAEALDAKTFGDLEQLREAVETACLYIAQYAFGSLDKSFQVSLHAGKSEILVRVAFAGTFLTEDEFQRRTSLTLESATDPSLLKLSRTMGNYGGRLQLLNGLVLAFPRK
jgi:hypothetical protein